MIFDGHCPADLAHCLPIEPIEPSLTRVHRGPPKHHTKYPRSRLRGYCGRSIPTPPQRAAPTLGPTAPSCPGLEPERVSLALPATTSVQWRAVSPTPRGFLRRKKPVLRPLHPDFERRGFSANTLRESPPSNERERPRSDQSDRVATGLSGCVTTASGTRRERERENSAFRAFRNARIDPRCAFVPSFETSVIFEL